MTDMTPEQALAERFVSDFEMDYLRLNNGNEITMSFTADEYRKIRAALSANGGEATANTPSKLWRDSAELLMGTLSSVIEAQGMAAQIEELTAENERLREAKLDAHKENNVTEPNFDKGEMIAAQERINLLKESLSKSCEQVVHLKDSLHEARVLLSAAQNNHAATINSLGTCRFALKASRAEVLQLLSSGKLIPPTKGWLVFSLVYLTALILCAAWSTTF